MGLWSKIKSALSQGASNSSSTGTGNTAKPSASSSPTTATPAKTTITTPKISSSTPRTNSTDASSASVPTRTTSTNTPVSSTNKNTVSDYSGADTALSQAYKSNLSNTSASTNILNGSAGGFKAFDNSGQSANEFVNDPNNSAYVKADTNNISAGEGYVNSDGSAKLVTSPSNPNPVTDTGAPSSMGAWSDVTSKPTSENIGKTGEDVINETTKIISGTYTGDDGKSYGFYSSANSIPLHELEIFKGLLAQGYTEDQANEILNAAYKAKGATRKKDYQLEDGTWTYGVYGELENEKVDKESAAGKYKTALSTDTTPTTVTEAKNLLEQKLNSLASDYKDKEDSAAKEQEKIDEQKKESALSKRLRQKSMAEAANFYGLGSGNRTQEQLAMDEAYRNKLTELKALEDDNTALLAKYKEEYNTNAADANNAYESYKKAIKEETAAKKAEEQKTFASQAQEQIDESIKNGTTNPREVAIYLNTALANGQITKDQYNALIKRYYNFIYS